MVELSLTLCVQSPLVLHQNRASAQFAPALDYIPGSTLRGALASLYLQGDSTRAYSSDFQDLFLNDLVLYPDLLPATNPDEPCRLVPATAWACKRFGDSHAASVTDTLLRLELADELREQTRPDWHSPLQEIDTCPVCAYEYNATPETRPRERMDARYASSLDPTFRSKKVELGLHMGTAVDRATGAVAAGMLFSQQAIADGQRFSGRLRLHQEDATRLEDLLRELAPEKTSLHVGYGRSRGLGHVRLESWRSIGQHNPPLAQRWQDFNLAVHKLWHRYRVSNPSYLFFSLTLNSHLALQDSMGRPVLEQILTADLGLPWANWGRRTLSAVAFSGWNAAWGLPKTDTWALARGSVLLGRVSVQDKDATLARLAELETMGAGERRSEGLGRLRVCDEFHYHFTLRELT